MAGLKKVTLALATAGLLSSGVGQAALLDRGGGLIYDTDYNITWLADANYAKTSGYDADGLMNWSAANTWAANLVYGGYSDWRLPITLQPDATCGGGNSYGYNCTGSEMGHLFYTEGGVSAGSSITSSATLNTYFTNMQSYAYWSGTAYAPNPADAAWLFGTYDGFQYISVQGNEFYAWAVRPGDVAAAIPEPETYALLLAGLGLLGVVAKRRRRRLGAS